MKKFLFLLVGVILFGCQSPVSHDESDKPLVKPPVVAPPVVPVTPAYVPPTREGAKEINVLRYPGSMGSASLFRGLIAQNDPMIGECNEPGTVYIFFPDNALVQYVPEDGTNVMFRNAVAGDVEAHNSLNTPDKWWDFIYVPFPGPVYDMSNDPPCPPLTVMILDNSGTSLSTFAADNAAEYATWCYANGQPKPILTLTFEGYGANDGVHILHMQLGGDGLTIPAATFHY